jgi:hypothetical protein
LRQEVFFRSEQKAISLHLPKANKKPFHCTSQKRTKSHFIAPPKSEQKAISLHLPKAIRTISLLSSSFYFSPLSTSKFLAAIFVLTRKMWSESGGTFDGLFLSVA